MLPPSRRSLLPALSISLLLHAVLLLGAVRLFPPVAETPAALNVLMTTGKHAPVPENSARPVADTAAPVVHARQESSTAPMVVADVPSTSKAQSAAVPAPASVSEAAPATASPSAATAAPAVASASSGVAAAATAPVRERVNADDLRQYRFSLAAAARRFKRYPALARERGWEGTAEVTLTASAALPAPEVSLTRSSGRVLLDEQALAMVNQAWHSTPLPAGLKGKDFRVLLPVTFSLDDQ